MLPSVSHYTRQDGLGIVRWLVGFLFVFQNSSWGLKCEMLEMAQQLRCKCNDTYIYVRLYFKMEVLSTSCFFQVIMQIVVALLG